VAALRAALGCEPNAADMRLLQRRLDTLLD
jgi:hypothetical protein